MIDLTTPTEQVILPRRRLGKAPAKFDPRTLRMAHYIEKRALPKIPKTHLLSKKTVAMVPWEMLANDDYGDCTCAAKGHACRAHAVYGKMSPLRVPSRKDVLDAYGRINGGVDNGASMLDALKDWRNIGMGGDPPFKIKAFVSLDPLNHDQVRTGAYLFGGLYAGANLPISAQEQEGDQPSHVWDVVEGPAASPGSWGGHAFYCPDYLVKGPQAITWGHLQRITWAWWDRYVDECYVVLNPDYVGSDNRSPQGFSLDKLERDLKRF